MEIQKSSLDFWLKFSRLKAAQTTYNYIIYFCVFLTSEFY